MQLPTLGTKATLVDEIPDSHGAIESDTQNAFGVAGQKRILRDQGIPVSIEVSVV
jgi:hypothetical protein